MLSKLLRVAEYLLGWVGRIQETVNGTRWYLAALAIYTVTSTNREWDTLASIWPCYLHYDVTNTKLWIEDEMKDFKFK